MVNETLVPITLGSFNEYVTNIYCGSSRPLNYLHLLKGCLLQFAVKLVLEGGGDPYVEADEVGVGADFNVGISSFIIPIECKNEKYHVETPQSIEGKVVSRFKDYPTNHPKLLVTTPRRYTSQARKTLIENNVQVIELASDINSLDDLERMMSEIHCAISKALYKYRYYKRYHDDEHTMKPSIEKDGVAVSFTSIDEITLHVNSVVTEHYVKPDKHTSNMLEHVKTGSSASTL